MGAESDLDVTVKQSQPGVEELNDWLAEQYARRMRMELAWSQLCPADQDVAVEILEKLVRR